MIMTEGKRVTDQDSPLLVAIDQGTSSTRIIVFDPFMNSKCSIVASHQVEIKQILPQPGWVEHDPNEYLESCRICMQQVAQKINHRRIRGIGIANQRETVIAWDKKTGAPFCNSIVWSDTRTREIVERLKEKLHGNEDELISRCGLPLTTYFSALKMVWLMENCALVKEACESNNCCFGTVDSFLLWHLTDGKVFATDVTNASRTMLMNLKSLQWETFLLTFFGIAESTLPRIVSCAENLGIVSANFSKVFQGLSISGCLGDQHAALLGQLCLQQNELKVTYGTGCFILLCTGSTIVKSQNGLLSTVAFKLGPSAQTSYALEGSVAIAGAAVKWFRDSMGCVSSAQELDEIAAQTADTAGVYFVPAFSGLFAPYWRSDARGVIVGLTQFAKKAHVARAILEATCFQTREILDVMLSEYKPGISSSGIKVDGGMTNSDLMLQLQADIMGMSVLRPQNEELTALGAAIAAGIATQVFSLENERHLKLLESKYTTFLPKTSEEERTSRFKQWKKAVTRSLGWIE